MAEPGTGASIAIVGAGIAGLTTAAALADGGHRVTVFERRTRFDEPGAGIQLSPNASRILLALGLGPALARAGSTTDALLIRSLDGGAIARVPFGAAMMDRFGAPYLSVARQDLHAALLDAVRSRPGVALRVGRSLVGAERTARGIRLRFETGSGHDEAEADLAVGADGLWSRARALSGDGRLPRPAGATAFRAVVSAAGLPAGLATASGLWLGRRRHVVHYPIRRGAELNLVVVAEESAPAREGWSETVPPDRVTALFDNASPDLLALLSAPEAWSAWSLFDLPVRRCRPDRLVLIGDAAHPILPYLAQGGAMAIEDAAALAAAVTRHPSEPASASRAFAARRFARVRRVQAESRRNGTIYHLGNPTAAIRNAAMRRLGEARLAGRLAWLYGWQPDDA